MLNACHDMVVTVNGVEVKNHMNEMNAGREKGIRAGTIVTRDPIMDPVLL